MAEIKKPILIFMPSMEGGGVEKNIIIISNYLSKFTNNIKLITYDKKFKSHFNKNIKIINPRYKKKKASKYFKYFQCLLLLIKEVFYKKDILVFSFQANIYCLILSKILNFKIIIRSNSSPSGWNKNYIKNLIFKIFFKFSDSIIVNSKAFKNELDNKLNVKSKVIYNPLNKLEIISKSKERLKSTLFKKNNKIKILNIGRYTDQKDQITLLKALNLIKNKIPFEAILIGYGVNKKLLENFVKKNNLKKQIKVLNYQNNPYKFIKKTDILILCSIYEGLPNVILEALTLKKFVISSNCPTGPKEILESGKFGYLFKPKDFEKLSKLIMIYSKNIKKCKQKALAGYKSLDRFDYQKNCNKYLNEIRNIK